MHEDCGWDGSSWAHCNCCSALNLHAITAYTANLALQNMSLHASECRRFR